MIRRREFITLVGLGATPFTGSPAELDKIVIEQREKWGKVIRRASIKGDPSINRCTRMAESNGAENLSSRSLAGRPCIIEGEVVRCDDNVRHYLFRGGCSGR